MDNTVAMFPGSFDPPTSGHIDIINRACNLFRKVFVVIGVNDSKSYLFSSEERKNMLCSVFSGNEKVEVVVWYGLSVDFAKVHNIGVMIRGIRDISDCKYELDMFETNKNLFPDIDVIFLPSNPMYKTVSSSAVKKLASEFEDYSSAVPECILSELSKKLRSC